MCVFTFPIHDTLSRHPTTRTKGGTHQAVDHLVEHGAEAPPVHRAVVRLFAQHLWGQVLLGRRGHGETGNDINTRSLRGPGTTTRAMKTTNLKEEFNHNNNNIRSFFFTALFLVLKDAEYRQYRHSNRSQINNSTTQQ